MIGHYHRPNCKCGIKKGEKKRCTCGAKWAFTIDIGIDPQTGKRKQKKKSGFATKADAEKACALLIAELESGITCKETNVTFRDYAKDWLKLYDDGTKKPGSVRVRQTELNRLLTHLGHMRMKEISKSIYQNALDSLSDNGLAENSVSGTHSTGRMIFKKAFRDDVIKKDPTDGARIKRKVKTVEELEQEDELPKFMEKEQLATFLKAAKEYGLEGDYELFLTLAHSGMRIGELLALKITDIDKVNNTISITKTLYNPKKGGIRSYVLVTPKTKKSKREIIMTKEVIDVLYRRAMISKRAKIKHGSKWHDGGFVFSQLKVPFLGYPYIVEVVSNRMKRMLKIAGLPPYFSLHSFRHTHTSLLAEARVELAEIMDRLGHINDQTTRRVYLHVTKDKKKEAPQKFADLLKGL